MFLNKYDIVIPNSMPRTNPVTTEVIKRNENQHG